MLVKKKGMVSRVITACSPSGFPCLWRLQPRGRGSPGKYPDKDHDPEQGNKKLHQAVAFKKLDPKQKSEPQDNRCLNKGLGHAGKPYPYNDMDSRDRA